MNTKHTPGPWRVLYPAQQGVDKNWRVTDCSDTFVANVYGFARSVDEQSYVNAYLIAAAPCLLEALERVINDWVAPDGLPFEDGEMPALDAARSAVAKATDIPKYNPMLAERRPIEFAKIFIRLQSGGAA